MTTRTLAAFFIGALIAGSAQATPIDAGDGLPDISPSVGTVYHGTMFDYLCLVDGEIQLFDDWPFSFPPAPTNCVSFNAKPGLLWSVTDYAVIYDPSNDFTFNNLPDASDSSGGLEQIWTDSNVDVFPIPEPQILAIFLTGLGLIGLVVRRKKIA